jgi:ankyrin repeat protein
MLCRLARCKDNQNQFNFNFSKCLASYLQNGRNLLYQATEFNFCECLALHLHNGPKVLEPSHQFNFRESLISHQGGAVAIFCNRICSTHSVGRANNSKNKGRHVNALATHVPVRGPKPPLRDGTLQVRSILQKVLLNRFYQNTNVADRLIVMLLPCCSPST